MTAAGRFVWHELHTRDRVKALAFYRDLFAWETEEIPVSTGEPYGLCLRDGDAVAGVTLSKAPPGVPAYWLPYLGVDDVDRTADEARSLGARILREPADVLGVARVAVAIDPRGAVFGLRSQRKPTAPPAAPRVRAFGWDELLCDDPAAAAAFYAKLGGYTIEELEVAGAGTYRILRRGQERIAGVMKHPEDVRSHWLPYVDVVDADAATTQAVTLGASVYVAPRDVAGFGRFSGIDDPTGAGVCLLAR